MSNTAVYTYVYISCIIYYIPCVAYWTFLAGPWEEAVDAERCDLGPTPLVLAEKMGRKKAGGAEGI